MDVLTALGRVVPFAFASGVNLYATIAVAGLCARLGLVTLPEQFRIFGNGVVIVIARDAFASGLWSPYIGRAGNGYGDKWLS